MIKFLAGSCLSELEIVLKEPKAIIHLDEVVYETKCFISIALAGSFITSPYSRVLSGKNLIIP
jgi:hypothetical protein